jgi:hypothetical protein
MNTQAINFYFGLGFFMASAGLLFIALSLLASYQDGDTSYMPRGVRVGLLLLMMSIGSALIGSSFL